MMTEHTPQGKHDTYYPQKGFFKSFSEPLHDRVDRELSGTLTVMKWVNRKFDAKKKYSYLLN